MNDMAGAFQGTTLAPVRRRVLTWALLALAAVVAAAAAWTLWPGRGVAIGLLQINGRIEGDLVVAAPKTAGRIAELLVREGDQVQAGQLLARLTEDSNQARWEESEAAAGAQLAQVAALQAQLELLRAETQVQLVSARAGLTAAAADLRRARATAEQEARDDARIRSLAAGGVLGPQAAERSALALRSADEQEAASQAALARAQQAVRDAELGPARVRAKEAELAATSAQAEAARARVRQAASQKADLKVTAPLSGRVSIRYVNAGEVVAAGTPLFGITDLAHVYLKAYAPEPLIGRVRLGQAAQIWADAWPDAPFDAKVGFIASRAEFTPKEVQTRDERTKLVYEVRLYPVADPAGKLLPGQPADGMIRYEDHAAWQRPRD